MNEKHQDERMSSNEDVGVNTAMNDPATAPAEPSPITAAVIRETLRQGLPLDAVRADCQGRTSNQEKLIAALIRARDVLMRELGLSAYEADAWLVSVPGGTAKTRAGHLGALVQNNLTIDALLDCLVTQRRRGKGQVFVFRRIRCSTSKALYKHLVANVALPKDVAPLSYRAFVHRLSAQIVEDAGTVVVTDADALGLLQPKPNLGGRDKVTQAIHVIGADGTTTAFPNAERLRDNSWGLVDVDPRSGVSARQFSRNFEALIAQRHPRGDVPDTLVLTLEDLTALVSHVDRRLTCSELLQRIEAYEQRYGVRLGIPPTDACARYRGLRTKLPWLCPMHPHTEFEKAVDKLHQGCPACGAEAGIDARRIPYERLAQYIRDVVGAELLTSADEYRNGRLPLRLRTPDGILYERSFDSLRRCPFLVSKSASEHCMRMILEAATGKRFVSIGPRFLKPQIYDAYCEELKLNFECDGIQHFEFTPLYHRTPADFSAQQQRDWTMDLVSAKNGVRNVRVPYWLFPFADPYADGSTRRFDAPTLIAGVYDFLSEQQLGIVLRTKSEVLKEVADQLVALVNRQSTTKRLKANRRKRAGGSLK